MLRVPLARPGLKLGESVRLKVHTCASEAGTFDLKFIAGLGASFTKSEQDIVVLLTDCVVLFTISSLEFFGDQDHCWHLRLDRQWAAIHLWRGNVVQEE